MTDYIFLMHDDAISEDAAWQPYLDGLKRSGCFQGGSAIGDGICARKNGPPAPVTAHLTGFIRIIADSVD